MLDWAALRGINLQLAWVGYEQIFLESFRELGLTDDDILPFFSGPAFQSWNRFGNIQGSWGADNFTKDESILPLSFIEAQFALQKRIVARMVELGITPVLPAFPGFVPSTFRKVRPDAKVTAAPNWFREEKLGRYTRDLFLDPLDKTYAELQRLFVKKQIEAFGNVTNVYTLDQFNELSPASGDEAYLAAVAANTYAGLAAANPAAVWLLQGWLFYSSRSFWTQPRIEAYLGGVREPRSMLVLDLFSESNPQWQRTRSYAGRPWIWCQLHDFGGNMALEGRVHNLTRGPIEALSQSTSLVGMGLTPEAYEGNEIVYDLLLDQAWSDTPIDTYSYFRDWIKTRYTVAAAPSSSPPCAGGGQALLPEELYDAWEILRTSVYSNNRSDIPQVPVSTYQLRPAMSGIANRTGHSPHPTALHYDPALLRTAWRLMFTAASSTRQSALWQEPAFRLDFVDVTRQVLSNDFDTLYANLVGAYHDSIALASGGWHARPSCSRSVRRWGAKLLRLLSVLDSVLRTHEHFTLRRWVDAADAWAAAGGGQLFRFNARSQVTVWQADAPRLNDYAAKAWAGLVGAYYRRRWAIFVDALVQASCEGRAVDEGALERNLTSFERAWQQSGQGEAEIAPLGPGLRSVAEELAAAGERNG